MTALSLEPIGAADLPFVAEMLRAAAFWRDASTAPPVDEVLEQPDLAVYVEGWGRTGDAGLIARSDGVRVGAIWVRRFGDGAHGYGYLDAATPELSIAVAEGHRGCGIGHRLLAAMLDELRLRGVAQVSLSVEDDNPARTLYQRLGFVPVLAGDGATTMVRALV